MTIPMRAIIGAAHGLSPIDVAVLQAISEEVPLRLLARKLGLSRGEVYASYWTLRGKLGTRTKPGLVGKAFRLGVIE